MKSKTSCDAHSREAPNVDLIGLSLHHHVLLSALLIFYLISRCEQSGEQRRLYSNGRVPRRERMRGVVSEDKTSAYSHLLVKVM